MRNHLKVSSLCSNFLYSLVVCFICIFFTHFSLTLSISSHYWCISEGFFLHELSTLLWNLKNGDKKRCDSLTFQTRFLFKQNWRKVRMRIWDFFFLIVLLLVWFSSVVSSSLKISSWINNFTQWLCLYLEDF